MITVDCPPAVRQLHDLAHEIKAGKELDTSALRTPERDGVVQVTDADNPSKGFGNPVAIMAGRQIEAYVGLGKSHIEMLCADDAKVTAYIGDRVMASVRPQALIAKVRLHTVPGIGTGPDVLVDKQNREYGFPLPYNESGGVTPGYPPASGPGGVSPNA